MKTSGALLTATGHRPRGLGFTPLISLPIATQLAIGFIIAALVAAVGAGSAGFQRSQSVGKEADFYRALSDTNTSLTTGTYYLEITQIGLQNLISDVSATAVSKETVASDNSALTSDLALGDAIIQTTVQPGLGQIFPGVADLVPTSVASSYTSERARLSASAQSAWATYRKTVGDISTQAQTGSAADLATAQTLLHNQAEPVNSDATSALRALIRFDARLAAQVRLATDAQAQSQTLFTIIAAVVGVLVVGGVGWLISNGIVRRLSYLRRVTIAVENGQIDQRIPVYGRDELARVSASVNGMLDTIVGLLEETRRQRDALTTAADRLFADMRVAGAGDLRVNATVSNDPIGMLGNAFNLTVGRFRRFILRTQTIIEQLDVISRRQYGRTQQFMAALHQARLAPVPGGAASQGAMSLPTDQAITAQLNQAREIIQFVAQEGSGAQLRMVLEAAEETYLSARRLHQIIDGLSQARTEGTVSRLAQLQLQELSTLEAGLQRVGNAAFAAQKNATHGLREIYTAIDQLGRAALAQAPRGAMPPNAPPPAPAPHRALETLQVAGTFAQEIGEMAGELGIIIQEMRSGIGPFRTEGPDLGPLTMSSFGNPMPYISDN